MKRMNDWLANRMALWLSSMGMFWALTLLILLALALQRPSGAQGWVLFVVSIFFQGVALPVLAFVSNQQGDRTERVLRDTHDGVLSELAAAKKRMNTQEQLLTEMRQMHAEDRAWRERLERALERMAGGERDG